MVSITNITTSSMTVNWDSHGSHVAHYNIELFYGPSEWGDPVEGKQIYGISSGARSYGFTGLAPGRQYYVKLYSKNVSQVVIRVEGATFSTLSNLPSPPPAPSGLNVYNSGETWASFAWNPVSNATSYSLEVWRGNSLEVPGHYRFTGTTRTVTGLSPGVPYVVKLYATNEGGSGNAIQISFELGYGRPNNFRWSITKTRGLSYNIINDRFTNLINYDEFTAFRQRINDFRRYKRMSTFTFTNVGRGVVLTAALYNELNDAIAAMSPPTSTPGRKTSGTANLPALLNGLVTSLNSIK